MTEQPAWTTLFSRYLVDDEWLTLRADAVRTAEGHVLDPYYVAEHPDWVNCFTVEGDADAVFTRQYRHGAGRFVLELVSGRVDAGESPEEAVRRELLEEAGYAGGTLFRTGTSWANPANQTNSIVSFLAVGGACSEPQALEPGETLVVEKVPLTSVPALLGAGDPRERLQSHHLASALLALNYAASSSDPRLSTIWTALTSAGGGPVRR